MRESSNIELSERELEILKLVATGASNKEIAQRLFISANTVKVHLRNIFAKTEVASRTEAALYAMRLGLVETPGFVADDEAVGLAGSPARVSGPVQPAMLSAQPAAEVTLAGGRERSMLRIALVGVVFLLSLSLVALFLNNNNNNLPPDNAQLPVQANTEITPAPTDLPRWQRMTELPTARSFLALVAYEASIYAIGGQGLAGPDSSVERYDPEADTWERRSDKPVPVSEVDAVVVGGLIYVPGGRQANGMPTNVLEVYDPIQDAWAQRAPLPASLSAYAVVEFEGRILVFGGWDGQDYVGSVYEYDPSRDEWQSRTPMPTGRGFAGAVVAKQKIYVLGGQAEQGILDTNEVYVPAHEGSDLPVWNSGTPLPGPRTGMGIAGVADIIYLVGGEGPDGGAQPPLGYVSELDMWQILDNPLPGIVSTGQGVVGFSPRIYVIGGTFNGAIGRINLRYRAIYTIEMPIVQ